MPKKIPVSNIKIEPTNFDLAVVEVVEYIDANVRNLNLDLQEIPNKKELLDQIGISFSIWPQMVNHYRHVSTKSNKQADIVKLLRKHYWVNPDYIWKYPTEKEMFVIPGIEVMQVNEYEGKKIPSSAKLLKKELVKAYQENTSLRLQLEAAIKENSILKVDIENLRMLIEKLKPAKNPAKK